ncbi:MAG TPA: fibronectin type III domain-containing protein [Polyangia bacterium]
MKALSAIAAGALALVAARAGYAATACRVLQFSLEPDCFVRGSDGHCTFDAARPDLGPQIAVWVETASGQFIDTVFVTNAVGLYGIGNRPGRSDLRSGPRFPYGRRPMALPVWAHRRGKQYPAVLPKDGLDDTLTFHERVSSPEPYFCRPMLPSEVVDAVTCASGTFRSDKGVLDPAGSTSFYPPRGDLLDGVSVCIPKISNAGAACDPGDAGQFEALNDLDAVAGATPPYDKTFTSTWSVPDTLASGDYRLMVEVGKELDANAAFAPPSYLAPVEAADFGNYGWDGNLGQPSVLYAVPFHLGDATIDDIGQEEELGSGDPWGATGDLTPAGSPSAPLDDKAGSGWGRLRDLGGPGPRHLVVTSIACAPLDCASAGPPPAPRIVETATTATATTGAVTFYPSSDHGAPALAYEMRATLATGPYFQATDFAHWPTVATAGPADTSDAITATVTGLTPQSIYAVGLRARGRCGWSAPSLIRLVTPKQVYRQLSGCVIATAALGSDREPRLVGLRHLRDRWATTSPWGLLLADLYGQSAPPLAHALARSDSLRAWVRAGLETAFSLEGAIAARDRATSTSSPPARRGAQRAKPFSSKTPSKRTVDR